VLHNLVEKSGAWYSYKGERIGQGRENAKQFLKEHKDAYSKLEAELRKALNIASPLPAPPAVEPMQKEQAKAVARR
jgi:recombination protein RecA